jgi:hypothetical protein
VHLDDILISTRLIHHVVTTKLLPF